MINQWATHNITFAKGYGDILESLACGLLGDCFLQIQGFHITCHLPEPQNGVHGVCTARDEMEERNIKAMRKDCLNLSLFKEPMKS